MNAHALDKAEGVTFAKQENGKVYLDVGSGTCNSKIFKSEFIRKLKTLKKVMRSRVSAITKAVVS
jgi:hypothetical protein